MVDFCSTYVAIYSFKMFFVFSNKTMVNCLHSHNHPCLFFKLYLKNVAFFTPHIPIDFFVLFVVYNYAAEMRANFQGIIMTKITMSKLTMEELFKFSSFVEKKESVEIYFPESDVAFQVRDAKVYVVDKDGSWKPGDRSFAVEIMALLSASDVVKLYSLLLETEYIAETKLSFAFEEYSERVRDSFREIDYLLKGAKLISFNHLKCNGCKGFFPASADKILHASAICQGKVHFHLHFCYPCYKEKMGNLPILDCSHDI